MQESFDPHSIKHQQSRYRPTSCLYVYP